MKNSKKKFVNKHQSLRTSADNSVVSVNETSDLSEVNDLNQNSDLNEIGDINEISDLKEESCGRIGTARTACYDFSKTNQNFLPPKIYFTNLIRSKKVRFGTIFPHIKNISNLPILTTVLFIIYLR